MNKIMPRYIIQKSKLNQSNFFEDLLNNLFINKIADKSDIYSIQNEIIKLLCDKVYRFTKGESSSVREEAAQSLLESIYYILSEYFKTIDNLDDSINIIKEKSLKSLYKEGKSIIDLKMNEAEKLLKSIKKSKINVINNAYNDTIDNGIDLFFKEYDKDFGCCESPGDIDYPLNTNLGDIMGIDYIYEYLKILNLENRFLEKYDSNMINELLNGYSEDSTELLINIFELVLTNVVGSACIDKNVLDLNIEDIHREYLKDIINGLSQDELETYLLDKSDNIFNVLNITDKDLKDYIRYSISKLTFDIYSKNAENSLETIFLSLKPIDNNKIIYMDSQKTSNSKFRKVAEKIRSLTDYEEKIAIINSHITSLEDLVDILEADCLFNNEYINLFDTLDDTKLALLLKYMPDINFSSQFNKEDFNKEWQELLYLYLDNMYGNRKDKILYLSKKIVL